MMYELKQPAPNSSLLDGEGQNGAKLSVQVKRGGRLYLKEGIGMPTPDAVTAGFKQHTQGRALLYNPLPSFLGKRGGKRY